MFVPWSDERRDDVGFGLGRGAGIIRLVCRKMGLPRFERRSTWTNVASGEVLFERRGGRRRKRIGKPDDVSCVRGHSFGYL